MPPPNQILISSTRVEEGHHDRVTVWNRGGNAGTLTVQKGDGAEVAARLEDDRAALVRVANAARAWCAQPVGTCEEEGALDEMLAALEVLDAKGGGT